MQSNIQTFGRLRKIEGKSVDFYYFYCRELPKHTKYHQDRLVLLKDRVRTVNEIVYDHVLGSYRK